VPCTGSKVAAHPGVCELVRYDAATQQPGEPIEHLVRLVGCGRGGGTGSGSSAHSLWSSICRYPRALTGQTHQQALHAAPLLRARREPERRVDVVDSEQALADADDGGDRAARVGRYGDLLLVPCLLVNADADAASLLLSPVLTHTHPSMSKTDLPSPIPSNNKNINP